MNTQESAQANRKRLDDEYYGWYLTAALKALEPVGPVAGSKKGGK